MTIAGRQRLRIEAARHFVQLFLSEFFLIADGYFG